MIPDETVPKDTFHSWMKDEALLLVRCSPAVHSCSGLTTSRGVGRLGAWGEGPFEPSRLTCCQPDPGSRQTVTTYTKMVEDDWMWLRATVALCRDSHGRPRDDLSVQVLIMAEVASTREAWPPARPSRARRSAPSRRGMKPRPRTPIIAIHPSGEKKSKKEGLKLTLRSAGTRVHVARVRPRGRREGAFPLFHCPRASGSLPTSLAHDTSLPANPTNFACLQVDCSSGGFRGGWAGSGRRRRKPQRVPPPRPRPPLPSLPPSSLRPPSSPSNVRRPL